MSKHLINQYYNNLDRAIQFGKSKNEESIRNYFWILLNEYARKQDYEVVTEVRCLGTKGVGLHVCLSHNLFYTSFRKESGRAIGLQVPI